MLSASSGIEVVGEARDGVEAVEMTARLKPDVVTMDIQMPRLDGFEATRRIMAECPTPIIIVSSIDPNVVDISMEALRAGALDVVPKPPGPSSPGYEQACRYLAATVRAMSGVKLVRRWSGGDVPTSARPVSGPATATPKLVAIAASTGGPAALRTVFAELPTDFPLPIVVVQHIAAGFVDGFATWLRDNTHLQIKIAKAGEKMRGGNVYLAPDDLHLGVSERGILQVTDAPKVGSFRPSGDFLFESVGKAYGSAAVGVVLTGMGSDGLQGIRALKAAGGRIIAQDEASSVIYGMPGVVVQAGLADRVLPLGEIAAELAALATPAAR